MAHIADGAAGGDRPLMPTASSRSGHRCRARMAPARTWRNLSGVPIEDVTVHVTLLGGGFGRKSKCDFVHEAARLSMEVGAPVRVQWTREDDVQHSFYHTTSAERIEVALDENDKPTGMAATGAVAPSILSTFAEDSGEQFFIEYGMGFCPTCRSRSRYYSALRCENGKAMALTRASAGSVRSHNIPRAPGPFSPSRRSWRTSSAGTRRTCFWS